MANGDPGECGDLAPLPVEVEHEQKSEIVINLPLKTEEKTVTRMDLLMRNLKVVTPQVVLV